MSKHVLVVCIGNICRSPTAELLFRQKLSHRESVRVSSAGLGALVGRPMDSQAMRILHERGIDTTEGITEVGACKGLSDADCFALKRPGGPLDATLKLSQTQCDIACVLILAGGIHRTLPAGTRVILTGMAIRNRLAPNVSDEHRESLTAVFGEQFRLYLHEMGVDTELLDIVDRNMAQQRATEVPPSDWSRLHIVTSETAPAH